MTTETVLLIVLTVLLGGFVIWLGLSFIEPEDAGAPITGEVIRRDYDGETNASGVGPSIGGGGGGVAFVSVHEDEKWNLVVQSSLGLHAYEVTKDTWTNAPEGSLVLLIPFIGRWFGGVRHEVAIKP